VIASACQLHNDPICNPRPIQTAVRLNAQIGGYLKSIWKKPWS
jgi:hypothetical protein